MASLANLLNTTSYFVQLAGDIKHKSDVERRLNSIAAAAKRGDIRTANNEEHALFLQTLAAIAARQRGPDGDMARAALKTLELVYDRGD